MTLGKVLNKRERGGNIDRAVLSRALRLDATARPPNSIIAKEIIVGTRDIIPAEITAGSR